MSDEGLIAVLIILVLLACFGLITLVGQSCCASSCGSEHTFTCYDDSGSVLWTENTDDYHTDGDYAYTGDYDNKHICRTHWTIEKVGGGCR